MIRFQTLKMSLSLFLCRALSLSLSFTHLLYFLARAFPHIIHSFFCCDLEMRVFVPLFRRVLFLPYSCSPQPCSHFPFRQFTHSPAFIVEQETHRAGGIPSCAWTIAFQLGTSTHMCSYSTPNEKLSPLKRFKGTDE